MAAVSCSAEILPSSNSTRASAFSRLTSARVTPGSLSKAVLTETGQALQTIPLTSRMATWGAPKAGIAIASIDASVSVATRILDRVILNSLCILAPYIPART